MLDFSTFRKNFSFENFIYVYSVFWSNPPLVFPLQFLPHTHTISLHVLLKKKSKSKANRTEVLRCVSHVSSYLFHTTFKTFSSCLKPDLRFWPCSSFVVCGWWLWWGYRFSFPCHLYNCSSTLWRGATQAVLSVCAYLLLHLVGESPGEPSVFPINFSAFILYIHWRFCMPW